MIDFPANPTLGQSFTGGGTTWTWDGTKWIAGTTGVSRQIPISFPFVGKPVAGMKYNVPMAWSANIAVGLVGVVVFSGVLATANAVFTVNKISGGVTTQLGTITITSAGPTSCTLAGNGGILATGDVLQVVAPSAQDTTLADVGITLMTVRL